MTFLELRAAIISLLNKADNLSAEEVYGVVASVEAEVRLSMVATIKQGTAKGHTMTALQEAAMRKAILLCEWIAETPHQRGSINGQAAQVEYALRTALAQQGEQAKPAAYITDTWQGPMVWTPEMYNDACTYCDDGEFPVPLYTAAPAPQPTSGDYANASSDGWEAAMKSNAAAMQSAQPVAQPLAETCDTCAHYQQGKHPGVSIHDETCYECRSYWGNKWEAA